MPEARKAQHLRILQSGPAGPEDYREVQYLADKGLAYAHVQISYQRENYREPINVVWVGPTADGMDYMDDLLEDQAGSPVFVNNPTDNKPNNHLQGGNGKPGYEKPKRQRGKLKAALNQTSKTTKFVLVTAIASIIGGLSFEAVSGILSMHFEFFQFLVP